MPLSTAGLVGCMESPVVILYSASGWVVGENSSLLVSCADLFPIFVGVGVFVNLAKTTAQTGHTGYGVGFGQY